MAQSRISTVTLIHKEHHMDGKNKIEALEDQLWNIKQRLEYVESVLEIDVEDEEDWDPTVEPHEEPDHVCDDECDHDYDEAHNNHPLGRADNDDVDAEDLDHSNAAAYDSLPSDVEPDKQ